MADIKTVHLCRFKPIFKCTKYFTSSCRRVKSEKEVVLKKGTPPQTKKALPHHSKFTLHDLPPVKKSKCNAIHMLFNKTRSIEKCKMWNRTLIYPHTRPYSRQVPKVVTRLLFMRFTQIIRYLRVQQRVSYT